MIPATATFHARQTFGSVGYHQIHTLENIKRFIDAGIEYSVLTSQGFKHITELERQGTEQAHTLTISLLGKRYEILTVPSQLFWDFNHCKLVPLLELIDSSAILFNTSTDLRCNGVNIKYQVAEVVEVKKQDNEVEVFHLELQTQDPKVYVDCVENGLKFSTLQSLQE